MEAQYRNRIFRWKVPIYFSALMYLCLVAYSLMIVLALLSLRTVIESYASLHLHDDLVLVLYGVVFIFLLVAWLMLLAKMLLTAQRETVLVEEDGLVRTDWRGRQKHISWTNVIKISIFLPIVRSGRVTIVSGSGFWFPIPTHFFPGREELIQKIIAEAALENVSDKWYRTVYACSQD